MSENENDPFAAFESERTIIKPSAGRARAGASATPAGADRAAEAGSSPTQAAAARADGPASAPLPELGAHASLNPLVHAASPLLSAAPRLRAMPRHPNPQALRASLVEAIRQFELSAQQQQLPNEQLVAGRYVLCTLLDESASSTPWGSAGAWASQSLLVQFHNESWGGEKVFQLLARLMESPAQHRNLLELIYLALSLGFEGRYKVLDKGREQLDAIRERLAQVLRQLSGPVEPTLSPHWQGVRQAPARLRDGISPWLVAALSAFGLLLILLLLRLTLGAQTDASFLALQALHAKAEAKPALAAAPVAVPPRLAQLLRSDIEAGAVQVRDELDRSVVTVLGDTMFEPGSADVAARATPLFGRIAAALQQVPGRVAVVGHSDNQAIRSLRFPSNWHLSLARAQSVRQLLGQTVEGSRLAAEGRADSEPVADNATAEGRARNRRVDIVLTVSAPL